MAVHVMMMAIAALTPPTGTVDVCEASISTVADDVVCAEQSVPAASKSVNDDSAVPAQIKTPASRGIAWISPTPTITTIITTITIITITAGAV
jgi:hypothetical protein